MVTKESEIKEDVRKRYTQALSQGSGCCAPSCCGGGSEESLLPRGRVVSLAGYTKEDLTSVPQDAVQSSFGCGNPLAFAEVKPGQVVVDIGSGAGIDCFIASEKVGPAGRVIGVDMTPAMIERARENARRAGVSNVEFRLGEAESMPVEDASADWIISNCVINLSPDKPRVFREAYRALKAGGRLSISDIMVEELPAFLRESAALYSACVAGAISEREYVEGLRSAGFQDVQVTERIVYDREQIKGLIGDAGVIGKVAALIPGLDKFIDDQIANKVWSAKIVAQK